MCDLVTCQAGVVVAPKGVRPVEKEPRSILPTAEGRSSFSRHTDHPALGVGCGVVGRVPGFARLLW